MEKRHFCKRFIIKYYKILENFKSLYYSYIFFKFINGDFKLSKTIWTITF